MPLTLSIEDWFSLFLSVSLFLYSPLVLFQHLSTFSNASTHLYMRVYPSVGRSVFFLEPGKLSGNVIETLKKSRHTSLTANFITCKFYKLQINCKPPAMYLHTICSKQHTNFVPVVRRIFFQTNLFSCSSLVSL